MTSKERIEEIKAEILGDMSITGMHEAIDQMEKNHFQRMLKSQESFIHGDTFYFGLWSRWRRATSKEEADAIMEEFREKTKA